MLSATILLFCLSGRKPSNWHCSMSTTIILLPCISLVDILPGTVSFPNGRAALTQLYTITSLLSFMPSASTSLCWTRPYPGESWAHRYGLSSCIAWSMGKRVSRCLLPYEIGGGLVSMTLAHHDLIRSRLYQRVFLCWRLSVLLVVKSLGMVHHRQA